MTLTSASWAPASTAASSAPEPPSADASDGLCAIHQPNLFPRLSTLAKLFSADLWVVLDDVQFARRDYQHRARLAALDDPSRQQWLTLPTHLPHGRPTLISQARLVDPRRSRRTVQLLVRQYYGRSPYWGAVSEVLDALDESDRLADLARTSTIALLSALGWSGKVQDSSAIPTRQGRSERLVDLAAATGSTHYLCGTGGLRYLDAGPFYTRGIPVLPFHTPVDDPLWRWARRSSSLWVLSKIGPDALADQLAAQREAHHPGAHA